MLYVQLPDMVFVTWQPFALGLEVCFALSLSHKHTTSHCWINWAIKAGGVTTDISCIPSLKSFHLLQSLSGSPSINADPCISVSSINKTPLLLLKRVYIEERVCFFSLCLSFECLFNRQMAVLPFKDRLQYWLHVYSIYEGLYSSLGMKGKTKGQGWN